MAWMAVQNLFSCLLTTSLQVVVTRSQFLGTFATSWSQFLNLESIDSSSQHLNSQQPSIHFTTETKNDKIAFLTRQFLGNQATAFTTIYRKPTHTCQYEVCESHYLQSVKCGIHLKKNECL